MAILSATVLQDAIASSEDRFGKFENRLSEYGALQAFKDNSGKMLAPSQVEGIKKSIVQTVKVPVLNKHTTSVITAPSCTITGGRPTSAFKSLTWVYKGFEVKVIPSINDGNYVSLAEDLGQQLRMGWKAVFANMDTAAVSSLEANKNAVVASSSNPEVTSSAAGYDFIGKVEELYVAMPGLLAINDLTGPYADIANAESISTQKRMQTLGQANQQNLGQFIGDYAHYLSNRVTPSGTRELHYFAPEGSIALYNWIQPDNRAGRVAGNKEWATMQDPMFGFDWEVFKIADCVDADAEMTGNARAYQETWQIGAYFCYLTEYSSDTSSPIIKVTVSNPS